MNFDIIAVTDARFLYEVFIALALVFNTDDYTGMIGVGLMIGLLFTMFRAWTTAKVEPQYIFISLFIYMGFIAPKVEVDIEDLNTGSVFTQDDIPFGIGVIGEVMSTVSYSIVGTMETAFSTPGMHDQNGFLGTLKRLEVISKHGGNSAPDFVKHTIASYISNCTHPGIALGVVSYENILNSNTPLAAIEFDSPVYTTKVTASDGTVTTETCRDAYSTMTVTWASDDEIMASWGASIGSLIGESAVGANVFNSGSDMEDSIQAVLSSTGTALEMAVASLVLYGVQAGDAEYAASTNNVTMTVMLSDATKQRNADAYGAAIGFQQVMRPFSSFIEAFFFAITPIAFFLLMLGAWGVSMLGKYLQLYAWIQMWTPMMSIVNFFINYRLKDAYSSLTGLSCVEDLTASPPIVCPFPAANSVVTVDAITNLTSHWLYVGNTMAASVPILALILVTGSVYSINSVAQNMSGKDYMDEKKVAPDTYSSNAGRFSMGAHSTSITGNGGVAIGREQVKNSLYGDISSDMVVGVGEDLINQKTAGVSSVVGKDLAKVIRDTHGISDDGSVGNAWQHIYGSGSRSDLQAVKGFTQDVTSGISTGVDKSDIDSTNTALSASLSLPGLAQKLGIGASVQNTQSWLESFGVKNAAQIAKGIVDKVGQNESLSDYFQESHGFTTDTSNAIRTSAGITDDVAETLRSGVGSTLQNVNSSAFKRTMARTFKGSQGREIADMAGTGARLYMDEMAASGRNVSYDQARFELSQGLVSARDDFMKNPSVENHAALLNMMSYAEPSIRENQFFNSIPESYVASDVALPGGSENTGQLPDLVAESGLPSHEGGALTSTDHQGLKKAKEDMGNDGKYGEQRKVTHGEQAMTNPDLAKERIKDKRPTAATRSKFAQWKTENDTKFGDMINALTVSDLTTQVEELAQNQVAAEEYVGEALEKNPSLGEDMANVTSAQFPRMSSAVENSSREFVAYVMALNGDLQKEAGWGLSSNFGGSRMYGDSEFIDENFTVQNPDLAASSPSDLIESTAAGLGEGLLLNIQRYAALSDPGVVKAIGGQPSMSDAGSVLLSSDNETWNNWLQSLGDGSVNLEMIDQMVESNPQKYPTTVIEMAASPEGIEPIAMNDSGGNPNWSGLMKPDFVEGNKYGGFFNTMDSVMRLKAQELGHEDYKLPENVLSELMSQSMEKDQTGQFDYNRNGYRNK